MDETRPFLFALLFKFASFLSGRMKCLFVSVELRSRSRSANFTLRSMEIFLLYIATECSSGELDGVRRECSRLPGSEGKAGGHL